MAGQLARCSPNGDDRGNRLKGETEEFCFLLHTQHLIWKGEKEAVVVVEKSRLSFRTQQM